MSCSDFCLNLLKGIKVDRATHWVSFINALQIPHNRGVPSLLHLLRSTTDGQTDKEQDQSARPSQQLTPADPSPSLLLSGWHVKWLSLIWIFPDAFPLLFQPGVFKLFTVYPIHKNWLQAVERMREREKVLNYLCTIMHIYIVSKNIYTYFKGIHWQINKTLPCYETYF